MVLVVGQRILTALHRKSFAGENIADWSEIFVFPILQALYCIVSLRTQLAETIADFAIVDGVVERPDWFSDTPDLGASRRSQRLLMGFTLRSYGVCVDSKQNIVLYVFHVIEKEEMNIKLYLAKHPTFCFATNCTIFYCWGNFTSLPCKFKNGSSTRLRI